jgi:hypothetical protein
MFSRYSSTNIIVQQPITLSRNLDLTIFELCLPVFSEERWTPARVRRPRAGLFQGPRRQMGAWKKGRHDGARNILVRLGKAAGLREAAEMDVEVPSSFTRCRPSDSQDEDPARRPGHAFRGQLCLRVRAPGRRPLGIHRLQVRGLRCDRRSNANIQQRHNTATPLRREVPVRR